MRIIYPEDKNVNYCIVDLTDIVCGELVDPTWSADVDGEVEYLEPDFNMYVFAVPKTELFSNKNGTLKNSKYLKRMIELYYDVYAIEDGGKERVCSVVGRRIENMRASYERHGLTLEKWEEGRKEFLIDRVVSPNSAQTIRLSISDAPKGMEDILKGEKHLDIECQGRELVDFDCEYAKCRYGRKVLEDEGYCR